MKALTLALCILALLGSAASGFFWWQIGETKTKLQADLSAEQTRAAGLQTNLTETSTELETTKSRLANTDAELGDTKSKLTASEARNVQAGREIASLRSNLAVKEETEKKLSNDLDNLRRELVQTRLAAQVGNPEEVERYKQTIASLENRLAALQSTGMVGAFDASGAAVPAGSPAASVPLSERTAAARVASVGTKNAFVVIDLGSPDGISVGNKFTITRGGETIAESVISEVKETFAIAQVAPTSIKTNLRSGDIASIAK
ncbi:MAG: hypothetical protein MUE42_01410 [Opitutaceae bacterium]|nr:hypothetical protein [Opitutaceae bacterium]